MSKFSNSSIKTKPKAAPKAALKTKDSGVRRVTREGGAGFQKGTKTELFTLAVTNMVGEATFYESADARDSRFVQLVHQVAVEDPQWIAGFIPYLRDVANMRSASIVVAAEAAKALLDARPKGAQETAIPIPDLIASAIVRPDEPGEMLGYWLSRYGRSIPMGVKRGIARSAKAKFHEKSVLKYDGAKKAIRFGDILNLTHAKPDSAEQSVLFDHILGRRHGHLEPAAEGDAFPGLPVLSLAHHLEQIPSEDRRDALRRLGPDVLGDAGFTWERLSGWIPGGMDAEAWEAIIPSMGYMALLRNLRNFEEAKVSKDVLKQVRAKLEDPEQVAKSRQFPFRFFSAWKASGTTFFGPSIEEALELSVQNIPVFSGRTLVAIDTSGSMSYSTISERSSVMPYEVAAVFAASVAAKSDCVTIAYATNWEPVDVKPSVLRTVDQVRSRINKVGMGTNTWGAVNAAIKQYGDVDRVIVFTDMQDHCLGGRAPEGIPVYVWDLSGQPSSNINTRKPGHYMMSGFTDSAFKLIGMLEAGADASWPWLND